MSFKDIIIKCLSSSDEVSFGRTMSAIAFTSCILWDTFLVGFAAWKFNATMNVHDILPTSEQLRGQVTFCGACYAINKVTEIMSGFSSANRNNNA